MIKTYPELCKDPYGIQQLDKKWTNEALNPQLGLLSNYYTKLFDMLYKAATITIDKRKDFKKGH